MGYDKRQRNGLRGKKGQGEEGWREDERDGEKGK